MHAHSIKAVSIFICMLDWMFQPHFAIVNLAKYRNTDNCPWRATSTCKFTLDHLQLYKLMQVATFTSNTLF